MNLHSPLLISAGKSYHPLHVVYRSDHQSGQPTVIQQRYIPPYSFCLAEARQAGISHFFHTLLAMTRTHRCLFPHTGFFLYRLIAHQTVLFSLHPEPYMYCIAHSTWHSGHCLWFPCPSLPDYCPLPTHTVFLRSWTPMHLLSSFHPGFPAFYLFVLESSPLFVLIFHRDFASSPVFLSCIITHSVS